jgi:tetratricopeptide (TPR) repeat protein
VKYTAVHRVLLGLALAWVGPSRSTVADPSPDVAISAEPAGLKTAIAALGSSDAAQRDQAAAKIIAMGAEARQAISEAAHSEDPELRTRAAAILLKLPWYLPDDSPGVRQLLMSYGQLDSEKRKDVVYQLADLNRHGYEALTRLIVEEPSDDVRWAIVSMVRRTFNNADLENFRKLEMDPENAPLLAAAGHAWFPVPKELDRGVKLLRQALAVDLERPSNDGGEVEIAFDRLQNLALLNARYDEVAELLRLRARRGATDSEGEPSKAVLNLFAAHGKFGPLAGFDKDLQTYHDQLGDPRIMFALGKLYERCGQRALAQATIRSAFLVDLVSIYDRLEQGDFLIQQGWFDLAEGEFTTIYDLSADHSGDDPKPMPPDLYNANAHFRLARVAAGREDDFAAADEMQQALSLHHKAQGDLKGATEQGLRQEIAWHFLRAAHQKGDKIEVQHRLDELAGDVPSNPDIANDVVPFLREIGREKEAKELFDKVYQTLKDSTDARIEYPMVKNNLAWLCARCGEKKTEALQLAKEACQAMPDNAAYFDTLAEAYYQLGNYEEAVKQETRVVNARPSDRFLQAQLKRFQNAAKNKTEH